MTASSAPASPPSAVGQALPVGARAEMYPSLPLPDLNAVGGAAFTARFMGEAASSLMAILCNAGLPPRVDSITAMRSLDHPSVLRLIDSGVVRWPEDGTHYYAFAYQRPLAPRLMQSLDETHAPLSEDSLNHYFVVPMIGALAELMRTGSVHNAIRPTNIFWRIGGASPPQLGECLSAPAGYGQPVLFESLERAGCLPMGRGTGSHADDCYAFGVTLTMMVLGHNPMQGMDDRAIIQAKMERGSFLALIGNRRLPASHVEVLRGLLTDDAHQRWTAADLEQWISGRRLTPKNTESGRRAARSLSFNGKEFWQVRPLAAALPDNPSEAVHQIENGAFDKWLRRSLNDDVRAENIAAAQASLKENGKTGRYEDQLVARACIALDPSSPIHYQGISVLPMGIANMLVEAVTTGNHLQPLSEIISSQMVSFWITMQKEMKTDMVPLGQMFERAGNLIEKGGLGNGVERVMYELNPGLPCLSPLLHADYVMAPKAMLAALERLARTPNRPAEPMDRHIAAFLIVRDRRSELLFSAMTASDHSPRRGIALLTLFSEMQYRYGPDALPNLAQWILPMLEIAARRYLSKGMQEKMLKQLRESAATGDLGALLKLVDDPRRVEGDQQGFMAARILYFNTLKEIHKIEAKLANRDALIRSTGKPMAATLSCFLAVIFVLLAILRAVWQGFAGGP